MSLPDVPNTLREKYYSVMAGQNDADILPDIETAPSTENRYLDYIAKHGGGGGSTVEVTQIKTSGEKIATITVDNVPTDLYASAGGGGGGAVDTVNGMTGDVVLTASDVGALPDNTSIPSKTSDLTNDSNFAVDASYVHTDNNYTTAEKTKLSGIAAGAEVNVQPDWSQTDTDADDYIKNKPTLGTAATKNSTNAVTDSTDLVESGAVATALTGEDIANSATGTSITLTDSASARVHDLKIYGRTESGHSVGESGLTVTACGKNIFNGQWLSGKTIDNNTGEIIDTSEPNRFVSVDIRVNPLITYYGYNDSTTEYFNVHCYDENLNWLGSCKADLNNSTFTTLANTAYIRLRNYVAVARGTKWAIYISDLAINGQYIPYVSSSITITTALPLRSNGDVKDEIDFADGVAITRIDSNGDVLATPVITPLSATEKAAFEAFKTFDGNTNVTATDDPSMSLLYIKNTDNGKALANVDNRIKDTDISGKADKVSNATANDLAKLDASGNLVDSGIAAGNVATTTDLATKEAAILQTAALTLTTAGWSSKQQTITLYPTYSFKDANRNVIDITLGEEQDWADSGVLPASTTTTTVSGVTYLESITFECEDVPSSALTFKVTSMEVS